MKKEELSMFDVAESNDNRIGTIVDITKNYVTLEEQHSNSDWPLFEVKISELKRIIYHSN
ncbi:hypothetical protein LBR02_20520 [Levilactobacillus brevis]|uniref:hypothetical protein n=1 Tax=Levilactobacillus brevis TaxID=1580 RepID=UPI001142A0AF|nr:hypothetical protein [Levilactobacillus brevis]GEA99487.1 hypothetical protein LBR02_20520 [Levilactobacillus brevis]